MVVGVAASNGRTVGVATEVLVGVCEGVTVNMGVLVGESVVSGPDDSGVGAIEGRARGVLVRAVGVERGITSATVAVLAATGVVVCPLYITPTSVWVGLILCDITAALARNGFGDT